MDHNDEHTTMNTQRWTMKQTRSLKKAADKNLLPAVSIVCAPVSRLGDREYLLCLYGKYVCEDAIGNGSFEVEKMRVGE